MWDTFLPKLFNMSITASIIILAVLVLRLLLHRAPKIFSYALWAIVLVRLLCPVSISSSVSLLNIVSSPVTESGSPMYIPENIAYMAFPTVSLPIPVGNDAISESLPKPEPFDSANPLQVYIAVLTIVWIIGAVVMLLISIVKYVRLKRTLVGAMCVRDNIYLSDYIMTPFVIGLFRPRIYLPSTLAETGTDDIKEAILLHEQHHIRRGDHIVRMFSFIALCMHWFNPLVWVAFVLSGTDMEMSCDEAAMRQMDGDMRKEYSCLLLSLATGKRLNLGMPLAFGEGDIKSRIKNVLKFEKPAFWIIIVAVIACIVAAVCFLTNPAAHSVSFDGIQIAWATASDVRGNEPNGRDLSGTELDELESQLTRLEVGRKDSDFGGFTPLYFLSIYSEQTGQFMVAGYDYDGKHVAVCFDGEYYRIEDGKFSEYLRDICSKRQVCTVKVVEIGDGVLTVEPVEGSTELLSGDRFTVAIGNLPSSPEPAMGDFLRITYDGNILETYPCQFGKIYSMEVVISKDILGDYIKYGVSYNEQSHSWYYKGQQITMDEALELMENSE